MRSRVRHRVLRRATADDVPAQQHIAEAAYSPYVARMGGLRPGPMETDHAGAVEDSEAWVALEDGAPCRPRTTATAAPCSTWPSTGSRACSTRSVLSLPPRPA
ncbi:hypothetical protein [Nocardioides hwasunensis]|uniref:N-acetyltransferase domain-containing protein n=1 Tax=Nocardioides hwasunensis TaxID=397258 RepID=A0ABR8MIG6_9ACTN|nr:hypothetical protein [Nocardioides hwasunensis]MBD3915830.1 hypothetical protein [Nocardioides hwasunensis]